MAKSKKKYIQPKYIKNSRGKVTDVYLDIDDFEVVMKKVEAFEEIKKKWKAKKGS